MSGEQSKFVVCYDLDYSGYLESLGFKKIKRFKDIKNGTGKYFDIFEYTKEFDKYLGDRRLHHEQ